MSPAFWILVGVIVVIVIISIGLIIVGSITEGDNDGWKETGEDFWD